MKYADIVKLHDAGLITADQRQRIIEHFQLKEDSSRFLMIVSVLGGLLVAAGIVLLIAANWEEIPRGLKLAAGLALMLGTHAGGWYFREGRGNYPKTAEVLHFVGSLLFLGNIALVGQIYHLSSRVPNAFLLWWVGIAALPWILRSPAQHVLSLLAFATWFGCELWTAEGWLFLDGSHHHPLNLALLGLVYLGFGYTLRQTKSWREFAPITEQLGLLALQFLLWPLTWGDFYLSEWHRVGAGSGWLFGGLAVVGLGLVAFGVGRDDRLTQQWRAVWGAALASVVVLAGLAIFVDWGDRWRWHLNHGSGFNGVAALVLFVFCLVQIQVGVQLRSRHLVNVGVLFIALNLVATYLALIGTMAQTGLMFVVSGVFLLVFGIYLEKKRRVLMQRIRTAPILETQP